MTWFLVHLVYGSGHVKLNDSDRFFGAAAVSQQSLTRAGAASHQPATVAAPVAVRILIHSATRRARSHHHGGRHSSAPGLSGGLLGRQPGSNPVVHPQWGWMAPQALPFESSSAPQQPRQRLSGSLHHGVHRDTSQRHVTAWDLSRSTSASTRSASGKRELGRGRERGRKGGQGRERERKGGRGREREREGGRV
jgi:hypothetical protein